MSDQDQGGRMRLDKWLWAARFFKTRQLAVEAITGGKVHLDGQRTKPGKEVRIGSRLQIHKGELEWNVEVIGLPTQRRPASEMPLYYSEDEESSRRRAALATQLRDERPAQPAAAGRPTKRDRRRIHQFTGRE